MDRNANRLRFFVSICAFLLLIAIARISYLTFFTGDSSSHRSKIVRGSIFDRRGIVLAESQEAGTIGIDPSEIVDSEFTAKYLSPYLDLPESDILFRIYRNQNKQLFYVKRQVDPFVADQIDELKLPGVYRIAEYRRSYPGNKLASNLIGFAGRDEKNALGGLELSLDDLLSRPSSGDGTKGSNVVLTIDSLIQFKMEQAMDKVFLNKNANRAAAILMDIRTGEILAVANYPNFDPNLYYESTPQQRGNWAFRLNYEPGSTMKVLMAAMLLSENLVKPTERFQCNGEVHFGSSVVRCKSRNKTVSHGNLTLKEIITRSCNVGIIKAMQRLPREKMYAYLSHLGFGERTEVLPGGAGETGGYLPKLEDWPPSNQYYFPIGQGFSVTPIQLLRAGSVLANGGHLVKPRLIKRIENSQGLAIDEGEYFASTSPFTKEASDQVSAMMRSVVEHGTGINANLPETHIFGKTGTGQKSSATGYLEEYVASFLGFFPYEKPVYGMIVLFDNAESNESGGSLAAPVFKEIVHSILPLLKEGSKSVKVGRLPLYDRTLPRISLSKMVNLNHLPAGVAVSLANQYGLPVELQGSGYVYKQKPTAGEPMRNIEKIILYLGE